MTATISGGRSRPRLVVVTAGLSQPSSTRLLADRLATATAAALRAGGAEPEVEVVELREWAHDLTNRLLTGFPTPGLRGVLDAVAHADAVVAVTPIFSASYSGLFKTFFDVLEPDTLTGTPVLVAATGGTARHSLALEHAVRPLLSYLRAVVVPTAVYAAPEDWASEGDGSVEALALRVDRAADELARLVQGRRANRAGGRGLVDAEQDSDVVPFSRLLAAQRAAGQRSR